MSEFDQIRPAGENRAAPRAWSSRAARLLGRSVANEPDRKLGQALRHAAAGSTETTTSTPQYTDDATSQPRGWHSASADKSKCLQIARAPKTLRPCSLRDMLIARLTRRALRRDCPPATKCHIRGKACAFSSHSPFRSVHPAYSDRYIADRHRSRFGRSKIWLRDALERGRESIAVSVFHRKRHL